MDLVARVARARGSASVGAGAIGDGPDRAGSVGETGGTVKTAIEGRFNGNETSVFYVGAESSDEGARREGDAATSTSARRLFVARDDVASSSLALSAAAAAAFTSASFAIL